ncbi:fatty acyl-CoA reductase wat isoform X2 [Drosophila yakuba]|uniref:fatty acyl-CoA reductase wat isoform X2 n=1 Tax=Drosophila yakuba TaxID=7245 RepID=UPI0019307D22|nr:fatty acyl-CoA reductase wat isoform X2 [Drosophila yakuba]
MELDASAEQALVSDSPCIIHHSAAGEMEEFFEDSEIFVTGGSGVVGKALVEKLLRSCSVRRIYVLLRPRRQLTAEQRLVRLRQATVFHVLAAEKPQELDKIVAVPGDVSLPGLGIEPAMMQRMRCVSLVYHCAATVRFDEPLREALRLNVGGTLEALKFAETLPQLRAFVHVSTFYSNPYLRRVEPKYYSSPMDWRLCLRLIDEVPDDGLLNAVTRKLIVGFPNTYTFTKNLAESLVNDYRHRLPVIVYRPSIAFRSSLCRGRPVARILAIPDGRHGTVRAGGRWHPQDCVPGQGHSAGHHAAGHRHQEHAVLHQAGLRDLQTGSAGRAARLPVLIVHPRAAHLHPDCRADGHAGPVARCGL